MAALTALFTLVGMNVSGKAASAVASLLLALGLLLAAGMLFSSLSQPEMTSGVTVTADGMSMTDPMPNPSYVGGMRREVYTFLMDALPTGQGLLMANPVSYTHLSRPAFFRSESTLTSDSMRRRFSRPFS